MGGGEASRKASRLYVEVLGKCLKKIEVNLTDPELSEQTPFVPIASDTVFHT